MAARALYHPTSAAILIGAEVFGAAFAGGWAVANLFGDLRRAHHARPVLPLRVAVMMAFLRNAQRVEPFITRG